MEYAEAITRLSEMESHFHDGFSSSDRIVLDSLHQKLFNREITNKGCSDCYRDAYILIVTHLKQTKEMPKPKSSYTLKPGALIQRPGDNRFYANPLPNDEVPEEYLADYPGAIIKFESFPRDWETRVALRRNGHVPEGELSQEEAQNIIEGLQADVKQKEQEIEALKAEIETLNADQGEVADPEELGNLRLENVTLVADLKAANEEIEALKKENASLKKASKKAASKEAPAKEEAPTKEA